MLNLIPPLESQFNAVVYLPASRADQANQVVQTDTSWRARSLRFEFYSCLLEKSNLLLVFVQFYLRKLRLASKSIRDLFLRLFFTSIGVVARSIRTSSPHFYSTVICRPLVCDLWLH